VLAAVGAACVLAAEGDVPPGLLDATGDHVEARVVVPDAARRVGEVRLVTRGNATVVQTVLATKVLGRVVAEITQKELDNWPPDRPGVADRVRYVEALGLAARELEAARAAAPGGERRLRLLIELGASPDASGLVLATFDPGDSDSPETLPGRRVLRSLVLGRDYVLRNMRLILADAFHLPESKVGTLGPLGPAALP
jgi:hypothetical protein